MSVAILAPETSGHGGMSSVAETLISRTPSLCPGYELVSIPTHPAVKERTSQAALTSIGLTLRAASRVLAQRPDIVHLFLGPRGSLVRKTFLAIVARMRGCRVLVHAHSGDIDMALCGSRVAGVPSWLLRICLSQAHTVATLWPLEPSPRMRGRARWVVIPNPVDEAEALPSGERATDIAFAGRLVSEKGVGLLADMVSLLRASSDVSIVVAGEAVEAEGRAAASRMTGAGAHLPGWLSKPDALALLQSARIVVLPSVTESLPMAALEAGAAGCRVLASPVGALPHLLGEGRGRLVDSDAEGWQSALLEELALIRPSEVPGAALREFVRANYSLAQCARALCEAYDDLVDQPPAPEEP